MSCSEPSRDVEGDPVGDDHERDHVIGDDPSRVDENPTTDETPGGPGCESHHRHSQYDAEDEQEVLEHLGYRRKRLDLWEALRAIQADVPEAVLARDDLRGHGHGLPGDDLDLVEPFPLNLFEKFGAGLEMSLSTQVVGNWCVPNEDLLTIAIRLIEELLDGLILLALGTAFEA